MVNFVVEDVTYVCCEQFMMASKAALFTDAKTFFKIMTTTNPAEHQKLGRQIRHFDQAVWDAEKYNIVLEANRARFTQSKECRDLLISTAPKILVEASPVDCIWGVGLKQTDPKILDPANWRGQNLLGKALTQVRDEILKQ